MVDINKKRLLHDLRVVQSRIDKLKIHLDDPKRARNYPARNALKLFIDKRARILAALGETAMESRKEASRGDDTTRSTIITAARTNFGRE